MPFPALKLMQCILKCYLKCHFKISIDNMDFEGQKWNIKNCDGLKIAVPMLGIVVCCKKLVF